MDVTVQVVVAEAIAVAWAVGITNPATRIVARPRTSNSATTAVMAIMEIITTVVVAVAVTSTDKPVADTVATTTIVVIGGASAAAVAATTIVTMAVMVAITVTEAPMTSANQGSATTSTTEVDTVAGATRTMLAVQTRRTPRALGRAPRTSQARTALTRSHLKGPTTPCGSAMSRMRRTTTVVGVARTITVSHRGADPKDTIAITGMTVVTTLHMEASLRTTEVSKTRTTREATVAAMRKASTSSHRISSSNSSNSSNSRCPSKSSSSRAQPRCKAIAAMATMAVLPAGSRTTLVES